MLVVRVVVVVVVVVVLVVAVTKTNNHMTHDNYLEGGLGQQL